MTVQSINPEMLKRMSRDDRELHQARLDEQSYRMNLALWIAEGDKEKETLFRQYLFETLMKQGRFDEAIKFTRNKPGCEEEYRRAKEAKAAEKLDDGKRCRCSDPVIEVPEHPDRDDSNLIEVTTSRYVPRRRYFSEARQEWMTIYRCQFCGHKQAIPGHIDDHHRKAADARRRFPEDGKGKDAQVMRRAG